MDRPEHLPISDSDQFATTPQINQSTGGASSKSNHISRIVKKMIAIVATFTVVFAIAFPRVVAQDIALSSGVEKALVGLRILAVLAAGYSALTFVKNRGVWINPGRMAATSKEKVSGRLGAIKAVRLTPRIGAVISRATSILIMFVLFWLLSIYLLAFRTLNDKQAFTALERFNISVLLQWYVPMALGIFVLVTIVAAVPGVKTYRQWWSIFPTIGFRGILAGIAALVVTSSDTVAHLIWDTGFGPVSSTNLLQLVDPNVMIFGKVDFLRLLIAYEMAFLVILGTCWLVVGGITSALQGKPTFALIFTSCLLIALTFNFLIQEGIRSPQFVPHQGGVVTGTAVFQVIILMMICMSFYLLINRYVLATAVIVAILGVFTAANGIKFKFRDEPIYPSELAWLRNPAALADFAGYRTLIGAVLLTVLVVAAAVFLGRRVFKGPIFRWKQRLVVAAVIVIIYMPIAQNLSEVSSREKQINVPILTSFVNVSNGDVLWQGSPFTARAKSLAYLWIRQMNTAVMNEPANYTANAVEELEGEYSQLAETINEGRAHDITDFTVIFVLSESLANPLRAGGVTVSENPLKYIDEIKGSTTGGLLYSHGFGGGTANMEAQSLTGLSLSMFSDTVSILNSDVLPAMSFIPSVSNSFEEKIALHPADARKL